MNPSPASSLIPRPARRLPAVFACVLLPCVLRAALEIPVDSSDGALVVTDDLVIDLSRATDAAWDADNSSAEDRGVYDRDKWAVVFKYTSVDIAEGATVTFINHPSRAPVVWLVGGDVNIAGTVRLDGQRDQDAPRLAEPGPGGFRGGTGWLANGARSGSGFGPGGGPGGNWGQGGSHGSAAARHFDNGQFPPIPPYGNASLLPLLGGSGGGGYSADGRGGGAGGGAILVACRGTLNLTGAIRANGGDQRGGGGAGSGGGIRLVATELTGDGVLEALGGSNQSGNRSGGLGRIRIERVSNASTWQISPDASVVPLTDGATPLLWLPDSGPTVRIVSIGGVGTPEDPQARFDAFGPDVAIPQATTTQVVVETVNVEPESEVVVRITPRSDGNHTEQAAGNPEVLNPNPLTLRWTAEIPVTPGNSAVQVRVRRP